MPYIVAQVIIGYEMSVSIKDNFNYYILTH